MNMQKTHAPLICIVITAGALLGLQGGQGVFVTHTHSHQHFLQLLITRLPPSLLQAVVI